MVSWVGAPSLRWALPLESFTAFITWDMISYTPRRCEGRIRWEIERSFKKLSVVLSLLIMVKRLKELTAVERFDP